MVVFAVVYGIAIQRVARKQALFEILEAVRMASVTIWGWIVQIAPLGVFALFANTAGTVQPDRLAGLLLYVGLFLAGTCILAFVVLPCLLAAVAPVSYREIMRELQPALVLAAVTDALGRGTALRAEGGRADRRAGRLRQGRGDRRRHPDQPVDRLRPGAARQLLRLSADPLCLLRLRRPAGTSPARCCCR